MIIFTLLEFQSFRTLFGKRHFMGHRCGRTSYDYRSLGMLIYRLRLKQINRNNIQHILAQLYATFPLEHTFIKLVCSVSFVSSFSDHSILTTYLNCVYEVKCKPIRPHNFNAIAQRNDDVMQMLYIYDVFVLVQKWIKKNHR